VDDDVVGDADDNDDDGFNVGQRLNRTTLDEL